MTKCGCNRTSMLTADSDISTQPDDQRRLQGDGSQYEVLAGCKLITEFSLSSYLTEVFTKDAKKTHS